jgi:dTDP-glucose pyrophosphorylase
MTEQYKQVLVGLNTSIKDALKQMNKTALQILIVVDDQNKLLGVLTDGDIRRALIKGMDFNQPINSIMTSNPIVMPYPADKKKALELMKRFDIRHVPVVDKDNKVINLFLWKDFLENGEIVFPEKSNKVIIMAGGKGIRLDPFTKILPKPLIPINDKPVIEVIMDNFQKYGFTKFIITLNYKAEMIKMYFAENPNNYQIEYIQEKDFLGTVGALSLLKNQLKVTTVVSNCDVIVDANYDDLLNYHKQNSNQITILGVSRNINIPYGILNMKSECADFEEIIEKPDYHFIVNSGVYVLEPEVVDLIPKNQLMDMPDLLLMAKKKRFKIQVYPANCSWFDIGEWEEYKKAMEYIGKYGR